MCQDENENEDEDELVGSFWCIFNIIGDERTSASSLLRLRTNEPYFLLFRSFQEIKSKKCLTKTKNQSFILGKYFSYGSLPGGSIV